MAAAGQERDVAEELPEIRRTPAGRRIPARSRVVAGNAIQAVVADGDVVESDSGRTERVQVRVEETDRMSGQLVQVGGQASPLRCAFAGAADEEVAGLGGAKEGQEHQHWRVRVSVPGDVGQASVAAEQFLVGRWQEPLVQRFSELLADTAAGSSAVGVPDRLRLIVSAGVGGQGGTPDGGD